MKCIKWRLAIFVQVWAYSVTSNSYVTKTDCWSHFVLNLFYVFKIIANITIGSPLLEISYCAIPGHQTNFYATKLAQTVLNCSIQSAKSHQMFSVEHFKCKRCAQIILLNPALELVNVKGRVCATAIMDTAIVCTSSYAKTSSPFQ